MVELAHVADKRISSFSLGMRQRAGLAGAIAGNPANLMLDEPVNGLDPMGVQWLRGVVVRQARSGRAVLLSSHLLSELELVADNVVMLDQGQVVRMGTMREFSSQAGPVQVFLHTNSDQALANHLCENGVAAEVVGDMVLVTGVAPEALADLVFRSHMKLYHLALKRSSLEETFMSTALSFEAQAAPPGQQPGFAPQVGEQYPQQGQGVGDGC
jgi:ABC-2 type transport system ATP-binding protein